MRRSDPELERAALRVSEEEFAQRFRHPFLVVSVDPDDDEDSDFSTVVSRSIGADRANECLVAVCKRTGANGFSFITIGRASNNDIVIAASSVSKCHAVIHAKDSGYTLSDAGSKNGTQVNGKTVGRHRAVPLRSGDRVTLSPRVAADVVDARAAHGWLRMQAGHAVRR